MTEVDGLRTVNLFVGLNTALDLGYFSLRVEDRSQTVPSIEKVNATRGLVDSSGMSNLQVWCRNQGMAKEREGASNDMIKDSKSVFLTQTASAFRYS
jgi:hypothetical protein